MAPRIFKHTAAALLLATALSSCSSQENQQQGQVPVVSVVEVQPQTVSVEKVLTGRLEASRIAEVRARVAGVLVKRLFEEGSMVKEGQALFTIDDSPYRAAALSAKANFTKAQADMARLKPLMEAGAISRQEWDAAVQAYQVTKAARDTANINLGYAHVTAPISGRIGRAEVTEGALVGQGTATLLATIQQDNPLYINFTQSADEMMKMRRAIAEGSMTSVDGEVPVTISFNDGTIYEEQGYLLFTDPTVDEATGQVSLRASIPNPDGVLFPGLFVNVHIATTEIPNAVLVPQQAVTMGAQNTVMVANADGSFEPRVVQVAGDYHGNRVLTGGLKAGDKVIVDGISVVQLTGAQKVQTRPWDKAESQTGGNNVQAASDKTASDATEEK